jgi:hypothetical protein
MFLDKKLKSIRKAKNSLAICCDLHRHLAHIEVDGIRFGARRTLSNLTLGLAVSEHILNFLRNFKNSRHP